MPQKKATKKTANPYSIETLGIQTLDKVIDVCEPLAELIFYPSALALRLWAKGMADDFCAALGITSVTDYAQFRDVVQDFFESAEPYRIDIAIACQAQRQIRQQNQQVKDSIDSIAGEISSQD